MKVTHQPGLSFLRHQRLCPTDTLIPTKAIKSMTPSNTTPYKPMGAIFFQVTTDCYQLSTRQPIIPQLHNQIPCQSGHYCSSQALQVARILDYFILLAICIELSNTMRTNPQRGCFQISTSLILPVSKIYCIFNLGVLSSSSGRE